MVERLISDGDFIALWGQYGSPQRVADVSGLSVRRVYARRDALSKRGIRLETRAANASSQWADLGWTFPREKQMDIANGVIVISSDHHYWPGAPSLAHEALLAVIRKIKPTVKILNGDVFDGGSIGRHPPFGWSRRPTAADELHAAQERVGEIEQALPKGCERIWNIGNHDIRFERNLASQVPDYAAIEGFRLADHFHGWEMQWSTAINWDGEHPIMVKHKNAGGVHAGYNNAMKGGVTFVTGHTHRLEAKPWGNYRCRRYYGIQSGTVSDLDAPQFEYTENGPTDACPGFVVLTIRDGDLLPPELCEVRGDRAYFRSEIIAEREKLAA